VSSRPNWCTQCRYEPVDPGNAVCPGCASSILKKTCNHPWRPELIILRTRNGHARPQLRCRRCYATVGHPKVREVNLDEADGEVVNEPSGSCARCGRTDAIELHHWAPWHLFRDADDWPTSLLCPDCHRLWHVTTGTDRQQGGGRG
jgi:hypothetical protein